MNAYVRLMACVIRSLLQLKGFPLRAIVFVCLVGFGGICSPTARLIAQQLNTSVDMNGQASKSPSDVLKPEKSKETQWEYRLDLSLSRDKLQGAEEIPISQVQQRLNDLTNRKKPIESAVRSKTIAEFRDGKLFGVTTFELAITGSQNAFRLTPFSAPLLSKTQSEALTDFAGNAINEPSYFDTDGAAIYEFEKERLIRVAWCASATQQTDSIDGFQYDLNFPWSILSEWELRLPLNAKIQSMYAPFEVLDENSSQILDAKSPTESPMRTWRLSLGATDRVTLKINQVQQNEREIHYVFSSEQIDWIVQSAGLEINASYVLEADSELQTINLKIDPRIRVRSLSWDQQPIDYSYIRDQNLIRFRVPPSEGVFADTQHRLLVTSVSEWPLLQAGEGASPHELPMIYLANGIAAEGRGSVSFHSDWELLDFAYKGVSLVSRSGLNALGGISRLDFNWKLSRPVIEAKLVLQKQVPKIEGVVSITNSRDQLSALARVRVLPTTVVWNRLQFRVPSDWVLESVQLDDSTTTKQTNLEFDLSDEDRVDTKSILFNSPIDNQQVDFVMRMRSAKPMARQRLEGSSQVMDLPKTLPLSFVDTEEDFVYEYLAATGFAIERSAKLLHASVAVPALDVWKQSKLRWPSQSLVIRQESDTPQSIRLYRQRSNIAVKSLLEITRDVNWVNCTYLIEVNPDPTGIQRFDFWIPESSRQLIWRVSNNNKVVLQEWREGKIGNGVQSTDNSSGLSPGKNLSLRFDRAIVEPMCLELRYRLPRDLAVVPIPQVSDYEFADRFVAVEDQSVILSVREKGDESLERVDLTQDQNTQTQNAMKLLLMLPGNAASKQVYLCTANCEKIRMQNANGNRHEPIALRSEQKLFVPLDAEAVFEYSFELLEVQKDSIRIALPKPWNLISVTSDSDEITYKTSAPADQATCEITVPEDERASRKITVQWSGPRPDSINGYFQLQPPKVETNIKSISHTSRLFISDEGVYVAGAQPLLVRWFLNAAKVSSPWNWNKELSRKPSHQLNSIPSNRYGFYEVDSLGKVYNFSGIDLDQNSLELELIQLISQPLLFFRRLLVLIASAVCCALMIKLFPIASMASAFMSLSVMLCMPSSDLAIMGVIGVMLGVLWSVARAVFAIPKQEILTPAGNTNANTLQSARRPKIWLRNWFRTVTVWFIAVMMFASGSSGSLQADENLSAADANNSIQQNPRSNIDTIKVVVPVDARTLKVAPKAFLQSDAVTKKSGIAYPSIGTSHLLSAQHFITCRPNQSVFGIYTATVVCKYRFRILDGKRPVQFPWDIRRASFQQFNVNGKTQYFGKNFAVAASSLIWIPDQTGDVDVELKIQLLSRSVSGRQSAQLDIVPCAAAQLSLDTDLKSIELSSNLSRSIELDSTSSTPIGPIKEITVSWESDRVELFGYERLQYDCDTKVELDQEVPLAFSRIRIAGYSDQNLTLDWNSAWVPVGTSFRDAKRGGDLPSSILGRQRSDLKVMPSMNSKNRVLDIEIYWKPVSNKINSIELPSPRILEATSNIRILRYQQSTTNAWTLKGAETWLPLPAPTVGPTMQSIQTNSKEIVLRVPDLIGSVSISNARESQNDRDVSIQANYLLGDNELLIDWSGNIIAPRSKSQNYFWLVDRSLRVDSIRIDGQEMLFTIDRWNESLNLVKVLSVAATKANTQIEFALRAQLDLTETTGLPIVHWLDHRIAQSKITIAKKVGLPISLEGLPASSMLLGSLQELQQKQKSIPYAEVLAVIDEVTPYQTPSLTDDAMNQFLNLAADRILAQIRVSRKQSQIAKAAFINMVLEASQRTCDIEFDFRSPYQESGVLLAVPTMHFDRFIKDAKLRKLSTIGDTTYLYVLSVAQATENANRSEGDWLHRASLSIKDEAKDSVASFVMPPIECISMELPQVYLNYANRLTGQSLQVEALGWQKVVTTDSRHDFSDQRLNQQTLTASGSRLPPVQINISKSDLLEGESPFAIWRAFPAGDELILEGVICVANEMSPSLNLDLPGFVQSAALQTMSCKGASELKLYQRQETIQLQGGTIALEADPGSVAQLIKVKAVVDPKDHRGQIASMDRQSFGLTNTKGIRYFSEIVLIGISEGASNGSLAVEDVAVELEEQVNQKIVRLLESSRSNLERLTVEQRRVFINAWKEVSQSISQRREFSADLKHTQELSSLIASLQSDASKYPELAPGSFFRMEPTDRLQWQKVEQDINLQMDNSFTEELRLTVFMRWCVFVIPILLLTLINLPWETSKQLRAMLAVYPWRLLTIIALTLAIVPQFRLVALALGILAGIVCVINYFKLRIVSS